MCGYSRQGFEASSPPSIGKIKHCSSLVCLTISIAECIFIIDISYVIYYHNRISLRVAGS